MKIPNVDLAIISKDKIGGYLLSSTHPIGRFKSTFFNKLGYTLTKQKLLTDDLLTILNNDVDKILITDFGTKYEVRGVLTGPNDKSAKIITVWIILNDEVNPKFITAYPRSKYEI